MPKSVWVTFSGATVRVYTEDLRDKDVGQLIDELRKLRLAKRRDAGKVMELAALKQEQAELEKAVATAQEPLLWPRCCHYFPGPIRSRAVRGPLQRVGGDARIEPLPPVSATSDSATQWRETLRVHSGPRTGAYDHTSHSRRSYSCIP